MAAGASFCPWEPVPMFFGSGNGPGGHAPKFNQRKARKMARRIGKAVSR